MNSMELDNKLDDRLSELSFQELKQEYKSVNKTTHPKKYKTIAKVVRNKAKKNLEFFKFFIQDYSKRKLEKLLGNTNKEIFPQHYDYIVSRINEFDGTETFTDTEIAGNRKTIAEENIGRKANKLPTFNISRAVVFFTIAFVVLQITGALLYLFHFIEEINYEEYKFFVVIFSYLYFFSLLLSARFIIKKFEKSSLKKIGVNSKDIILNVARGLLFYLPMGVYFLLMKTSGLFSFMNYKDDTFLLMFYKVSMIGLLGPIIEEIVFRGYLTNVLRSKFKDNKVVNVYNGLIFGIFHVSIISVLLYQNLNLIVSFGLFPFLIGILTSFMYLKYKSIIPSTALHITHNMMIVIFGYI